VGKTIALLVVLISMEGLAAAQPGQTQPQPAPYYPPPMQPQPQPAQVTQEEYNLLMRGEMTEGQHVGGGLLGTLLGFGTGHIMQRRWSDKGWIFTVGEAAAYGVLLAGLIDCWELDGTSEDCDDGWIIGGALAFVGLRIWEAVDVWAYPPDHNRRVRELRARVYGPNYYYQHPPMPPPVYLRAVDGGYTAGFTLRF
jgi:hypothetical protein